MTAPIDILIVDDEPRNLDALEAILANPEYRLLRAQDADTALRLLLEHDVAAIVLDIQMPNVSGFELAQMIKTTKRFRETPIVFLTAFMLDEQHVVQGYGAGAVDYLMKPFNPQILRHKIAIYAELFRKTRALAALNETLEERVKERTAELERSEAALREAAHQKDEFLAVLAHELRNPLAPLRTGVDLLIRRPEESPVIERTLAAMNRQLDHMVRLIDDLLDISRLSRGMLELKKQHCDLRSLVSSTVETFRPLVEREGQTLETDLPTRILVNADQTRIAQIVGNLVHNSMKFTPRGGVIRVTLERVADSAVVRVADSGIGIPRGEQDRVFDMFVRVNRPDGHGKPGLGIGLALARRLAEMHAGSLEATSEGEGLGSTFSLMLPALAATAVPAQEETRQEGETGSSPRHVVVIEDNDDVATTLVDWLKQRGHLVWVARNGQEGVRLAEEVSPEIVLCDIGLPEMDGLQVCREIRALGMQRQPLMVALTGWGRDDDRGRTREAGFDRHLVKPVAADDLEAILSCHREEPRVVSGSE